MTRRKRWTDRRRAIFIDVLRQTGNVSAAARAADMSPRGAYSHRQQNPDFAADWDNAVEESLDDLEAALRRRAVEGVEKPVFYGGRECGSVRSYSDSLGMFLLKSRRRSVFGDSDGDRPSAIETRQAAALSARTLLTQRLEEMAARGKAAS